MPSDLDTPPSQFEEKGFFTPGTCVHLLVFDELVPPEVETAKEHPVEFSINMCVACLRHCPRFGATSGNTLNSTAEKFVFTLRIVFNFEWAAI